MPAIDIILATMSMGPALIGEEMDDAADLTPGDMFHHIVVFCPGFQNGRVPSEKGTFSAVNKPSKGHH